MANLSSTSRDLQRHSSLKLTQIRGKLSASQPTIGTWVQLPSPDLTEILSRAGYDWIAFDLEHGSIALSDLPNLIRATLGTDTLPFVRLPSLDSKFACKLLDFGVYGLIIPNVVSFEHLHQFINDVTWPPSGRRGVSFNRANGFGEQFSEYSSFASSPFIVPMFENYVCLDQLHKILTLPIDAVLIGPYDLSASLGTPGDFTNSAYISAVEQFTDICKSSEFPIGFHQVHPSLDKLRSLIDKGFTFIAYGIDSVFISESTRFPTL